MLDAARHFKWDDAAAKLEGDQGLGVSVAPTTPTSLEKLFPSEKDLGKPLVVSSKTGGALVVGPDHQLSLPGGDSSDEPWRVYLDSEPTVPSDFTRMKTTSRDMYSAARARTGVGSSPGATEVILINPGDQLMEGSVTSVYFWREGRWVTPPTSSGAQAGTTRRWLLERALCVEEAIDAGAVRGGEECYISNGVRGWIRGRVHEGRC
ncbi:MAG: hypothetical protein M1832_002635 [Thelocarpon impressellum]|nr:MAG: hypothetical protein M1832_002635 [Thelocarpon impressellum]